MIKYVNECVGCPPERGCLGSSCPNRNVPVFICDKCGEEMYGSWDDPRLDITKDYHICRDCEPDEEMANDEIEYAEASQPVSIGR